MFAQLSQACQNRGGIGLLRAQGDNDDLVAPEILEAGLVDLPRRVSPVEHAIGGGIHLEVQESGNRQGCQGEPGKQHRLGTANPKANQGQGNSRAHCRGFSHLLLVPRSGRPLAQSRGGADPFAPGPAFAPLIARARPRT